MDLTEAYRECERITWSQARNFAYGIRLLPPAKRRGLAVIYAFARRIDDIGDGALPSERKIAELESARQAVLNLDGNGRDDPVLLALADVKRSFPVPMAAFGELIDGCVADVRGTRYETFEDLHYYCRCVAGSIGRLSLGIFGTGHDLDEAARLADSLGVALQLTNILRDIREDHQNGRTYLPAEDLAKFDVDPACLGGTTPPDPPAHGGAARPPVPPGPPAGGASSPSGRTGRNLPVAIGVGAGLGGLVLLTLLTVKATFLIYMGAAIVVALTELAGAFAKRAIAIPVIPIVAGGAAMVTCMYWLGALPALGALALTVVAVFAWRLPGGPSGYVKDVTAGVFALVYLPFLAMFVSAMLSPADGPRRVLTFIILTICSDIGGYFAGITLGRGGRHLMAPVISPKKTWEGFAGSVVACLIAGWLCVTLLLHGHAWQGLLTGAAAVLAAILGDLVESMIKRDLDIKDMGTLLPGHGGLLERLDSLLLVAPVVWLLLYVFVPAG